MAYYPASSTISVDAILTNRGRELLAKGTGFEITSYAFSDDEVDYSLWSPTHPLGSAYYGAVIETMPLVEAVPDETQVMRYKLVTLPRGTKQIPIISVGMANIVLTSGQTTAVPIRPSTSQGLNGPGFGYTAILYDSSAAVLTGAGLPASANASTPAFLGDASTANAVVARGLTFTLTPKDVPSQITTTLTIVGVQTGATISIPVTINPNPII